MRAVYEFRSPVYVVRQINSDDDSDEDCDEDRKIPLGDVDSAGDPSICRAIQEAVRDFDESELDQYFDPPLCDLVKKLTLRIEDGCAIARAVCVRELSEEELDFLEDELTGQYSDGWGEGFEQQSFSDVSLQFWSHLESDMSVTRVE